MKLTQFQARNTPWIGLLALFGVAVLFGAMSKVAQAQKMLYIDFETKGSSNTFPNKNFNNASEWNKGAQNKDLVEWVNVEHAGSGRLFQTRNTNANTTTTVAPAPANCKNWTDYTVQMTVTYDDDDKWPIVFRYTDPNNYYFFAVEQMDSDQGAGPPQAYLLKAPAADGALNGTNVVPIVQMPGLKIKQGGGQQLPDTDKAFNAPVETEEWVVRVVVKGNTIKCYFFPRKDIRKLNDPAPNKPIIEATDDSNPKGCVGIRNDTIVGTVDDFAVYGEGEIVFSVDVREKLAITWGNIKTTH
ncbi:hypothetical protein FJZ31_28230 [Candidatus Poribacteria bacterium]|nr:hypothetical protein [Candidatus Poribacteria bacterium]